MRGTAWAGLGTGLLPPPWLTSLAAASLALQGATPAIWGGDGRCDVAG